MKNYSLVILFLFASLVSFGQVEKKCGINEALEEAFTLYPELRAHHEAQMLLENSKVYPTGNSEAKSDVVYEIPVVFHIIHEYGSENISDAQVYDAMRVINEEYSATDPDSVDLVAPFDTLNGNAKIVFKLAAIDPYGNCTNGIKHIYSHESRLGDNYSKIEQWNRAKYLNIWVTKTIGSGAAAYSQYPSATDGSGFWYDGVICTNTYVGSIGTSSAFRESTLSHEIGHWLNLSHVWGNTNDPGVQCGDDGVDDTPPTEGHSSCPLGNAAHCDPLIQEDLQNYMDYAYCDRHFSPGQCERMRTALVGVGGQRNVLWQDSTLISTGIKDLLLPQDPNNPLTVPLCEPVADFWSPNKTICQGSFATFTDESTNAVVDSREWTFEGGSPATSTSSTVLVSWNTPGWKKVKLTVTNAAGSSTKEVQQYLYVSPNWPDYVGPQSLNMESNTHLFVVENPEDNYGKFSVVNGAGYNNSKAFKLQTYKDVSQADPYTNDYWYNDRLELTKDNLITPSFDLRHTSSIVVSFKYAYATNAINVSDITEVLKVYSSKNCGETWTTRKTINGTDLVTGGYAGNTDFTPATNTQWQEASFVYTATGTDQKTRFKFEFVASDFASNLFIDDINVNGILGVEQDVISAMNLQVYPNPSQGEAINISFTAQQEPTELILRDIQGKIVAQQTISETNTQVSTTMNNTSNLEAAYYFLEVRAGEHSTTKKVVVL